MFFGSIHCFSVDVNLTEGFSFVCFGNRFVYGQINL